MIGEDEFYVIKLLEYNYNGDGTCVCVPKSWIKLHRSESQVLVLYPKEDLETTLKRIEEGENYHKSWLLYRGTVIHVTDNFEEAKLWITKLNNGNEQTATATPQYTDDQSTSTTKLRSDVNLETNYESIGVHLKHEENGETITSRKRILEPNDAEEIEHKSKYKKSKVDMPNKSEMEITHCTKQVKGDCLRRELLSDRHYNLHQNAHKQIVAFETDKEINRNKSSATQNKSVNISSNAEISTNLTGQLSTSSSLKHIPIKFHNNLFRNNVKPNDKDSSDVVNNNCYSNEIIKSQFNQIDSKQPSRSPQRLTKASISIVPDDIYKQHGKLQTNIGKTVNTVQELQNSCTDTTNTTTSTQELEYLIGKYYELYDPTNNDQFLKTSVCKLLQEISELGTFGKDSDVNSFDSRPQQPNVETNPQSTNSSTHCNNSKIVTSSTELRQLNNQTLQNNLTKKPYRKEDTPDVINTLSDKLSAASYYVPRHENKITDSNSGEIKDSNQISRKNQYLPNYSSNVRNESKQFIEQTNKSQQIPEYEIIVEKSKQTNKITILDTSKKDNNKKITTSPDSTFNNEHNFPNISDNCLLTNNAHQIPNALLSSLKPTYPLNQDIQKLQNMSNQLTQPSCEQYPTVPQGYCIPPRYHQNHFNKYNTTDRVYQNTHFQGVQKDKTSAFQNVSNHTINSLPSTSNYMNRRLTQPIKNISQNFPFPVDHSHCCEPLYEEQFIQATRNSLHHYPGAQKSQYVAKTYPTPMHNLTDRGLPMGSQSVLEIHPNKCCQSFNYSNTRNSAQGMPTYAYQEQQQMFVNRATGQYERSFENHSKQTIRPETITENTCQLNSTYSNMRDKRMPETITLEKALEITVTKDRNIVDKQINSIHADKNIDKRVTMSQKISSQLIECPKEPRNAPASRESIEESCSRCIESQKKSSQNINNCMPFSGMPVELSLMRDVFENINLNINKLNSVLKNTNNIIEKYNESLTEVMNTINAYNQNLNEATASKSKCLTKTKLESKYQNSNNNTLDHNSNDDRINESQDVSNATIANQTSFVLPPDYDPADSRWTLKYQSLGRGIMELVPGSRVYINIMDLGRCLRKAKNCKKLARMLLREIFSQNALRVCSLTGSKAKSSKFCDRDVRPGLDANARHVLVAYVQNCGRRRGWYVPDKRGILKSIGGLLQRLRI